MKVLQINGYESPGRRFNGLAITPLLKKHDIESRHLIWERDTANPEILSFGGYRRQKINRIINRIERVASLQSVFYPNGFKMVKLPAFQEADLIHLHIIHSGYLSLASLPKITRKKPTVWTLHDPWALTGHCIHPLDCKGWMTGCGNCPDLKSPFPLLRDNTKFLFNYKRRSYKKSNFDIIVSSKWMRTMVETSPIFENVKIHQIPFGLDVNFFSATASPNARKRFNIAQDALVFCFRAENNPFKGIPYIINALEKIKTQQPVCLLTLSSGKELLDRFSGRFQLINLGWSHDEELVRDALVASDIFLMPSIAESFGMMAIEALACGKPVVSFEGTAVSEITFAPEIGVSVPMKDQEALDLAIQHLIDNPAERAERGHKGRKIVESHYSDELQAKRLAEVYREVVSQ